MPLNETIIKRKSFRSYKPDSLTPEEIKKIYDCIDGIKPLFEGQKSEIKILNAEEFKQKYGGMFMVSAPYYAVLRGEKTENGLLNAGFVGQNLVLGLTAMNYGTCWLGGAKDRKTPDEKEKEEKVESDGMSFIIAIALGHSDESFRAAEVDAERSNIENIAEGELNGHLEAIRAGRLAPSAMNMQPVRYLCTENKIHIFRSKIKSVFGFFDKVQTIDTGIAIANILAAQPQYKLCADVEQKPTLKGCVYMCTIS